MMKTGNLKRMGGPCLLFLTTFAAAIADPGEVPPYESAYVPKREVAQPQFLESNPEWDGRGVVIAVFDTGVDPSAAGMQVTTTGERKVLDILDASGSGDVDTRTVIQADENNVIEGLSGNQLRLPEGIRNPDNSFRIGLKRAADIFPRRVLERLKAHEAAIWKAELSQARAERERRQRGEDRSFEDKAPEDRTLAEKDKAAREALLESLEDAYLKNRSPIYFDCVLWHDGEHWRAVVDTDRDGDLADETALRPFGVAGEYAVFDPVSNLSFGIQVYEDGDLLSIVTVNGTHGTHVAAIAAAHDPGNPDRNGIAPGAQILSIRIGDHRVGGSYGDSERRAVALAAQAGVDIVNASWGGQSYYQDGMDESSQAYNMLAERYGILPVLSAGNNGPALSTLGSAGGEASRVVGVGAYVSPEMGEILYSTLQPNTESTLQFSSRGPSKDGDIGVDVTAPGAALASYSGESLSGFNMANGTSMSSPSVAGVAALLISAAKQEGLPHDPARVRAALMRGARWIGTEDVFTQGAGLVQVPGAWNMLKEMRDEPAFAAFYDVEVSEGSFKPRGRGLYVREPDPGERLRVVVRVSPAWIEANTPDEKVAFDTAFTLRSSVDWIEVPRFFHLANSTNHFIAHVTLPEGDPELGGLFSGEIQAILRDREELGPVFTIPVTVVRGRQVPEDLEEPIRHTLSMEPGKTLRWFLNAPEGADHLHVKVKHRADDPIARRFILHGLTLAAEVSMRESGQPAYMRLEEGEERSLRLPTIGGQVMELAVYQFWSSIGLSELDLELRWEGLGLEDNPTQFTPNQGWARVPYQSLVNREVVPKASLDGAVNVFMPVSAELVAFDERAELPPSPDRPESVRQLMVRQVFELSFEEPFEGSILYPQTYDISEFFGGGFTEVYHESGELLFLGSTWRDSVIAFPEGKSTVIRSYNQIKGEKLGEPRAFPLLLKGKLKESPVLPVYRNLRERFTGTPADKLDLVAGAPGWVFLKDTALEPLRKIKPKPDFFIGRMDFKDSEGDVLGSSDLLYLAGVPLKEALKKEPEPKKPEDVQGEVEKLDELLFERRLAFVKDQRASTDEAVTAKRNQLLDELIREQPGNPEPLFEKALILAMQAGLAGDWWKGPEVEEPNLEASPAIHKLLGEARALADPDRVAAFLGAPPVHTPGEVDERLDIERKSKEAEEARGVLVLIAQLEADLYRAVEDYPRSWQALREVNRWQKEADSITRSLRTALYVAEGHWGLALESLESQLKESPLDKDLLMQRVALYESLGWHRFAENEKAGTAIRESNKARVLKDL